MAPAGQGRPELAEDRRFATNPARVANRDALCALLEPALKAHGADHWFAQRIGLFSYHHQITGADAWTAAFVAMALTMVLTRVLVTWAMSLAAVRGTDPAAVVA